MKMFKASYTKNKNGKRIRGKTKKWYGRIRLATGKTVRVSLLSDKYSSERMLADLQKEQDQIRSGILPPQGKIKKESILNLLKKYINHLEEEKCKHRKVYGKARVQNQEKVAKLTKRAMETESKLKLVFGQGTFVYPNDISKETMVQILGNLRQKRKWSNKTYDNYIAALNAFFNWLVGEGYIDKKPYKKIAMKGIIQSEIMHPRRKLSDEEFKFLIESVKNQETKRKVKISKIDRINLYQIIFYTGLRAEELFQIKPEGFDFLSKRIIFVAGKTRKDKGREDTLPLHPDLVLKIKDWVESKKSGEPLFDCWHPQYFGTLFKKDMLGARDLYISSAKTSEEMKIREQDGFLKWKNSYGFADLHALRTTFISNIAQVASPKECQRLARHSDIRTTFNYYVKVTDSELENVVAKLPHI